ncbi:Rha family transcriptional regulator [Vibrio sp. 03-59-1]|uniref:Rha family transcriptional regulator n=1 Tax=Vibrio sp. 03-59-1 TaxID=2607607 RepID=UPI001493B4DD|nr:Rha family transcriptional regulator [Vibrio sp. 03-59-1]NOH82864.1 Rha family transcriptional regulator [Vibrio sp. 03-59-1]
MPTTSLTLTVSDLVFNQGEKIRTTSLKVSEAFNKQHKDVLKKLESLECSDEFNGRNFALVDYRDKKGQLRKAYEMTKDGFMFLVMGFTGTKAAHIKEACINAFNQMANQLRSTMPTLPPSQYQLPASCLPNFYDSGWLPAHYERCRSETHWTYHIKFQVRPIGGKFSAKFELGIGGKGKTEPHFSSSGAEFIDSGFYLEYRDIEELWENIRLVLEKYQAYSPY